VPRGPGRWPVRRERPPANGVRADHGETVQRLLGYRLVAAGHRENERREFVVVEPGVSASVARSVRATGTDGKCSRSVPNSAAGGVVVRCPTAVRGVRRPSLRPSRERRPSVRPRRRHAVSTDQSASGPSSTSRRLNR
jgi:hypothetical protein